MDPSGRIEHPINTILMKYKNVIDIIKLDFCFSFYGNNNKMFMKPSKGK